MEITLQTIGVIRSPFTIADETPIQASRSTAPGTLEIDARFANGLDDIEGFSHIILVYIFHRSAGYTLHVKPFLDDREHGLFATRYPYRPNPIGISIVRLTGRHGTTLTVEGLDVLDGTPLLDIKPYVPDFDVRQDVRTGWYEDRRKP